MAELDDQALKPDWLVRAKKSMEKAGLEEKKARLELDKYTVSREESSPGEQYEAAIDRVLDSSKNDGVETLPISPGNEFPTLFARLPIFIPSRRIKQKNDLMDINTAVNFDCPFGQGARKGPPLTTFDEDIFIALLKLRQNRVMGRGIDMPLECAECDWDVKVDHLVCSVSEIMKVLEVQSSGNTYRRITTSIKNMAATTIELEKRLVDRYFGSLYRGRSIRLYQVNWLLGNEEGVFEIQFEPIITRWLQCEFAYVEWKIRKQINGQLGKALHRFLSSQPNRYEIGLKKIASSVGFPGPPSKLSNRFRVALDELVDIGFLKGYEIRGTGKTVPLMLYVFR